MTKQDLIDAFCESLRYDEEGDETKLEFIARKQKQWAKRVALRHLQKEAANDVEADATGIDL